MSFQQFVSQITTSTAMHNVLELLSLRIYLFLIPPLHSVKCSFYGRLCFFCFLTFSLPCSFHLLFPIPSHLLYFITMDLHLLDKQASAILPNNISLLHNPICLPLVILLKQSEVPVRFQMRTKMSHKKLKKKKPTLLHTSMVKWEHTQAWVINDQSLVKSNCQHTTQPDRHVLS